jgi:multidrug efflux system membrane fusion protein
MSDRVMKRLGLGLLLAALVAAGCEKKDGQQAAAPMMAAAVTVAPAVTKDVPIYLDEIGKTVAVESVSVIAQVGGKIIATHVNDGDFVKKGDLLFEIDPRPFEAALALAKAQLAQSKAALDLAKSENTRTQTAGSAMSAMDIEQKKNAVDVGAAKVQGNEAAVQTAQLNLEYTKIFSPIDGRAGARLIDAGNVVKENDKPLLNIQSLDTIYAEFTITENDLGTVRKYTAARGMKLEGQPERNLTVDVDLPGNSQQVIAALGVAPAATQPGQNQAGPRTGPVTFLDNTVQQGTGTVRLRATLPNKDHYFWPGQFVNVRLVLALKKGAVLVPTLAQQVGQQGPYVYVIKEAAGKEDGKAATTAELRPIVQGQRYGDLVVVDKGVETGERVIVAGQMMVIPGGPVQVIPSAPPAGGAAVGPAKADAR